MKKWSVVLVIVSALSLNAAVAEETDLCADPAASCGRLLPPNCVTRLGAGALPTEDVDGCQAEFDAYRTCLAEVAVRCSAPRADANAERGPEIAPIPNDRGRLFIDTAQSSVTCARGRDDRYIFSLFNGRLFAKYNDRPFVGVSARYVRYSDSISLEIGDEVTGVPTMFTEQFDIYPAQRAMRSLTDVVLSESERQPDYLCRNIQFIDPFQ